MLIMCHCILLQTGTFFLFYFGRDREKRVNQVNRSDVLIKDRLESEVKKTALWHVTTQNIANKSNRRKENTTKEYS